MGGSNRHISFIEDLRLATLRNLQERGLVVLLSNLFVVQIMRFFVLENVLTKHMYIVVIVAATEMYTSWAVLGWSLYAYVTFTRIENKQVVWQKIVSVSYLNENDNASFNLVFIASKRHHYSHRCHHQAF
jgi:hypothetical protein